MRSHKLLITWLRRVGRTSVFRLTLLFAVAFSALVGLSLATVYWLSTEYIFDQIDTDLKDELGRLQSEWHEKGLDGLVGSIRFRIDHEKKNQRLYLLTQADGQVLVGNLRAFPSEIACGDVGEFSDESTIVPAALRAADSDVRVRAASVRMANGDCLLVGQAMVREENFTDYTRYLLSWAVGFITLISLVGGGWMGLSVLRRIDAISDTARQIMTGEFSHRIPQDYRGDEFTELTTRLNQMFDRIDELMAGMRSVTDNIAHDLRSPLTRLRNRLEVSLLEDRSAEEYRELMRQTLEDTDQILVLFNTLIAIAQAEAGVSREAAQWVDFSDLIFDLIDFYQFVAEEEDVTLEAKIQPGIMLCASRGLLTQTIVNLLENALRHVPAGSVVQLELSQTPSGVDFVMTDNGPGIPDPVDRARVLERFVRLETARSTPGSGLGLALVQAAMHKHGGTVRLEDNAPGLKVILHFPAFEQCG